MSKKRSTMMICAAVSACLAGPGAVLSEDDSIAIGASAPNTVEVVDFSFVFVGCNRVGWHPHHHTASTANVPQLKQTLKDLANLQQTAGLPQAPRFLFLLGDLVRNEQDDHGRTLQRQLNAWQTLWESLPSTVNSKTQPVLLPGNHELLASIKDPGGAGRFYEIPSPPTYDVWLNWLRNNGYDGMAGNGPTRATDPRDELAGDSSRMTYSFSTDLANGQSAHFVLINTDTLSTARTTEGSCIQHPTFDTKPMPGWIPAHWIDADLKQASADPKTEMIFALGHKPIQPNFGGDKDGRSNILNCRDYPLADQLLESFQANDKLVGYLASHIHEWSHLDLGSEASGLVPQIVAGNGGSPLGGGDIFGFTLVKVFTNGKVTATSYGRPAPQPYDSRRAGGPATPRETVVLRPANRS